MGNFKFGEHSTKDFDLVIQAPPTYNFPDKDVSKEHIPGRNGDLIIDNNCWKNTERTYSIASVFRPGTDFISNSERLIKWLTNYKGYHRLEDSYDPDVYRLAEFSGSGSLTNYYDRATTINVTFNCKPQRYLKNGENQINFNGPVAILENITGYPALPEISINGIKPIDNEILLVTVKNETENKVTSIMTLNKIISESETYDVIFNSELQTVYSIQNGDINSYVNLNDLEFPCLNKGKTIINIDKYLENTALIPSYSSKIDEVIVNNNICLAKYKPFDSVVESKKKSFYIMSYDLLKQKLQEVYEMKAYANYCLEKAEHYTFRSFNSVLSDSALSFSFQEDFGSYPEEWLRIINDNGQIKIYLADDLKNKTINGETYGSDYAYIMTTNAGSDSDKKITKFTSGELISDKVKNSSTVTINFYKANSDGFLAIDYSNENKPDWLGFEIKYELDSQNNPISPKKIIFKHIRNGYFYLPKSGLSGKASWARYSSEGELSSMTWSTSKKAFMPNGISTSTTASYEYYFLPYPYNENDDYLQYEDVYENVLDENGSVKKDANGNPIQKVSNKVYFRIVPLDDTLTTIRIESKTSGYFRLNDEKQGSGWRYVSKDSQIISGIKTTSSQLIYYLENIPTYETIDGWPEWLDNIPMTNDNQPINIINPEAIDFRVKKSAWYMYTYEIDNGTINTCWVYRNEGELLGKIDSSSDTIYPIDSEGYSGDRTHENNTTVSMLDGISSEFPVKKYNYTDENNHTVENIGFFYIDSNGEEHEWSEQLGSNIPPSWLKVKVNIGIEEDGSDTTLDFYPNQNGLYKWDAKTVWETKVSSSSETLVSSKTTDDTSIYYMNKIPQYPTQGLIFDYCSVKVNTNKLTGNPESITIYVKVAGYYRFKNNSSWKYYNKNDEICNSKVSEATNIYYLTKTENNELNKISMSIIPRWWSL